MKRRRKKQSDTGTERRRRKEKHLIHLTRRKRTKTSLNKRPSRKEQRKRSDQSFENFNSSVLLMLRHSRCLLSWSLNHWGSWNKELCHHENWKRFEIHQTVNERLVRCVQLECECKETIENEDRAQQQDPRF